ncbi:MAG: thioredoxin [Lachnospiraceae bacterium]
MSVMKITNNNFEQEVVEANVPVLVDFNASWCGPCQMLAPIIEELAGECEGKVKLGKLDIDEEMALAQKYKVMSVPTVVLFKEGKEAGRKVGLQSKEDIKQWILSE